MCQATLTSDNPPSDTIICIDRPINNTQLAPDQQSGVYVVTNAGNSNPAQRIVSVGIQTNLADATVAAYMEGTDENYLVAANKAIVGSLREALQLQRSKSRLRTHRQICPYSWGRY